MKNFKDFLQKIDEEVNGTSLNEEDSKSLAREDVLSMIASFVKDVKKKFPKAEDREDILDAAKKTLEFYIDEIDGDEEPSADIDDVGTDDFDTSEFEPSDDDLESDESDEDEEEVS